MNISAKKLTQTAMFAALACVATMIIRIPTPGTGGYIHPGDAVIVLSGIFLGPIYGALAAGIGSAMADLLSGYFIYVPITFIVKALTALTVSLVFARLPKSFISPVRCGICGIFSTLTVALGYLFFEYFIYGSAALASVPANLVQGVSGMIISTLLLPVLSKIHSMKLV